MAIQLTISLSSLEMLIIWYHHHHIMMEIIQDALFSCFSGKSWK